MIHGHREDRLTGRLVGTEMAVVDRVVDTELVFVPAEIDRVVLGQRGGEAVARRRLRGIGRDDRAERDEHEQPEQDRDPPIRRRRRVSCTRSQLSSPEQRSVRLTAGATPRTREQRRRRDARQVQHEPARPNAILQIVGRNSPSMTRRGISGTAD